MFKVGDYVVYKNEVCRIKELKENHFQEKDYYSLNPIDDDSLIIDVPVENKLGLLKPIMSKKDAMALIEKIPNIESITISDKFFDTEYRNLMNTFEKEDLIKVIKTTYLKNKERVDLGKKISEKDEVYFKKAERALYNELSISLGLSFDETKQYVIDTVRKKSE